MAATAPTASSRTFAALHPSARLGSALRFAITIVIADLIGLALFGGQGAATFTSFAAISALYFLDFDGSWRERLGGYTAATVVGLVGVVIGTLVANVLWVAAITALVVGFVFAFARVLRGYVARSAVGVQMAFLLAVLTPAKVEDLSWYLLAWLTGSVIAAVAVLVIFGKQHSGELRVAISQWCQQARDLSLAIGTTQSTTHLSGIAQAREDLRQQWLGTAIRPGLVSKRMRALMQMRLEAIRATRSLLSLVDSARLTPHAKPLSEVSAQGFDVAARVVEGNAPTGEHAAVEQARLADAAHAVTWTTENLKVSGRDAVTELAAHNAVRVLSISAASMQQLAVRTTGAESNAPTLGLPLEATVPEQLRANLTVRSFWFRNAIRSAIAVTVALVIARLLGLQHGIWVAMAALSVIQVSFSNQGTERSALRMALGGAGGVVVAAAVFLAIPQWWMFVLLLPISAFIAKWLAIGRPGLAQLTYTPFAMINVTVLSWPQPLSLADVRIEDIIIAMLVALIATFTVFPHGLTRVVESAWTRSHQGARECLRRSVSLLAEPAPSFAAAAAAEREFARSAAVFSDTVDAAYMATNVETTNLRLNSAREAWLLEVLLVSAVFRTFATADVRPADVPELASALTAEGEHLTRVYEAAEHCSEEIGRMPRSLVSATWSSWWLDHLTEQDPNRLRHGKDAGDSLT